MTVVVPETKHVLTSTDVLDTVCRHFSIRASTLLSRSKIKNVVSARKVCYYILREDLHLKLESIGVCMQRDHSTIMYGLKVTREDETLMAMVEVVRAELQEIIVYGNNHRARVLRKIERIIDHKQVSQGRRIHLIKQVLQEV